MPCRSHHCRTRPLTGATSKHYTFNSNGGTINYIVALGKDEFFAYHLAHSFGTFSITNPAGQATCVCDTGSNGELCNYGATGCNAFVRCAFFDRNLHSRMPLVLRLLRLKLEQTCDDISVVTEFMVDAAPLEARAVCDQWHSSRGFTPLTGCHCKLRLNTEGEEL
jgi:hypothetical protein